MMGIVSDQDFEKEIDSFSIPIKPVEKKSNVIDIAKGRPEGKKEVPQPIRALIAEEAICGASPDSIKEQFNTSLSSISAYKNDATSTASYHNPNALLKKANDILRDEVSSAARGRLMSAIRALDDKKISEAKARDIAGIAKDMSSIMKKIFLCIIGIIAGVAAWPFSEVALLYQTYFPSYLIFSIFIGGIFGLFMGSFFSSTEGIFLAEKSKIFKGMVTGAIVGVLGGILGFLAGQAVLFILGEYLIHSSKNFNKIGLPLSRSVAWAILGIFAFSRTAFKRA